MLHPHDGGAWFDPREPHVNPPAGHVQHWTRALDALLLAGAWLLEPLLGFARALHLWGVLISPVLLARAVIATTWAAAPALDRETRAARLPGPADPAERARLHQHRPAGPS